MSDCTCPTLDCCSLCGTMSCDCGPNAECNRKARGEIKDCALHPKYKPTFKEYHSAVSLGDEEGK